MCRSYKHKAPVYKLDNVCEVDVAFDCLRPNNELNPNRYQWRTPATDYKREANLDAKISVLFHRCAL